MKVYRDYMCDFGHHWVLQRRRGERERPEDRICPEGHEAVTSREDEPADEVQLLLRPAKRIVDKVTGQTRVKGQYWLDLLDREGQEIASSQQHYSWDEVLRLANLFSGKTKEEALKWWSRRKP